jgi:hypothetical protein
MGGCYRFLTRVAAFVAGAMFATGVVLRVEVVTVVTGHASVPGESNVPVHGLNLLLIGRGRQKVFIWLIGVEASANLALTIVFAVLIGPIGAAYAISWSRLWSRMCSFSLTLSATSYPKESLDGPPRRDSLRSRAAAPALFSPQSRYSRSVPVGLDSSCAFGLMLLRQAGRSMLASMLRDTRAS